MKVSREMSVLRYGLLAVSFLSAVPAYPMCIPCPCNVCEISSPAQANWVIMDRDQGRITLIPNIRITGNGEDFALILPTPSIPQTEPVSSTIWDQAFALTAPQATSSSRDFGCANDAYTQAMPNSNTDDGVDVLAQTRVGVFMITTLQASDPNALVTWLNQNGFRITASDAEKFKPYTDRNWVFCAMRVDPDQVQANSQWDLNVDPVAFTFAAEKLEVPLGVLSINRASDFKMFFFIVDEHRDTLDDFQTTYANRVSPTEYAAIRAMYPGLSAYLKPGVFLTRLDRTFPADTPMNASIFLAQAPKDAEFRRTFGGWMMSGDTLLLGLVALGLASRFKRPQRQDS